MPRASVSDFLPDDALKFRGPDEGALADDTPFVSPVLALAKLQAYWTTNEYGITQNLPIVIGFKDVNVAGEQITFEAQVAPTAAFSPPVTVARVTLTAGQVVATGGRMVLAVDIRNLANLAPDAEYLRLVATPAGRDQAVIEISDWLVEEDEFTLDDGTNGAESVKVGTMDVGAIAIAGGAMSANDEVIIDDGVHDPVSFVFGAGAGQVATGASAAASATNLAAAINAAVAAGTLLVAVADNTTGTLTITNLAGFTGGVITEDTDAGNRMTVTDFTGGVAGAVRTQEMIEAVDGDRDDQLDDVVAAIGALASGSFSATRDGDVISVVNSAPDLGVSEGEALEVADAGDAIAITDFAVATIGLDFWAYVKNGARNA